MNSVETQTVEENDENSSRHEGRKKTTEENPNWSKTRNEKYRNSNKPPEVNLTNRVGEKEVKISKSGDNIEEIDTSVKRKKLLNLKNSRQKTYRKFGSLWKDQIWE